VSKTAWALRLIFTAASLAWMAFIFWASSISPEEVDQSLQAISGLEVRLRNVLGHLAIYAILASLLQMSVWSWRKSTSGPLWWTTAVVVFSVLYGISDEYHQSLVLGREPSSVDLLTDGLGALTGVMVAQYAAASFSHLMRLAGRPFGMSEPDETAQ
jgi:VanZ family protein